MEKLTVAALVPEKKDASGKITQKAVGPFTINVNTGATATEMIALFGDKAVKSNADSNWVVTLQSNMRSGMKKGESQEALQTRLGVVKMGEAVRGVKIDPIQAYLAIFQSVTPEVQAKMLADLKTKSVK